MIRKLVVPLVLVAISFASVSNAQSAAEGAFRAGEKAFDRNDYVIALEEFKRAFREDPRDAVRFNIGVCLERLGRFKEAVAEYESAAASQELDAAKRERAKSEAERVRRRLGRLSATADVTGASLYVDGAKVCDLPCKLELDPRAHSVVARKADREATESVTLESGVEKELHFRLGAPVVRAAKTTRPRDSTPATRSTGPGILTWVGGGMAIVGTAGFIGFGLRARALEDEYDESPSQSTRDDGLRMQTFTNVSLGVAITGAALVAVDLLFFAPAPRNPGLAGVRF